MNAGINSNSDKSTTSHIAGLDVLRGLAILLVLLYHCTPDDNPNLGLSALIFKIAALGWGGVDLFFVLSGFLICRMLITLRQRGLPFSIFFWNRLIRIVPIYYLVLISTFLISPVVLNIEAPSFSDTYQLWFYVSNLVNLDNSEYYSVDLSIGHFWSLALEMQFYVVFPILLTLLPTHKLPVALSLIWGSVVSFRVYAIYSGQHPDITFGHSLYRSDGLIVGALIAALTITKASLNFWRILGFVAAIYIGYVVWYGLASSIFKEAPNFYLHRAALPAAISALTGCVLISILVGKSSALSRPSLHLPYKILAFFAKYSYGIYVYHFLFNNYLEAILIPVLSAYLPTSNHVAFAYFLVQVALSSAIAVISFHTIEKYFLSKKIRY